MKEESTLEQAQRAALDQRLLRMYGVNQLLMGIAKILDDEFKGIRAEVEALNRGEPL